jgi:transposase
MFRTNASREFQPETVNIEDLVPQDHLLRKINETIDFSFIAEKCRPLYCEDNGRPCIDPVMLFKMLLIGYLYGIRSERRLIEEIRVNIAYHWFVGLSLTDPVPHHSTFSQNRRRLFQQSTIYQEIFDEIVLQAMNHGFIEGKQLFTDSTFLKANASKSKFKKQKVTVTPKDYVEQFLTANLMVVIFHPSGFFVFGLADCIQLLGFAKLPTSGGIASAYVGTSVPFNEQGLGSDTCHRQIPQTEVDAQPLFALSFLNIKSNRQDNKPFTLFLVELRRSLLGRPLDDPIQPLLLIGPIHYRHTDTLSQRRE